MSETSPEMQAYQLEHQRQYSPLIAEFDAIIRHALRNDPEFDMSSSVMVHSIQLNANGGVSLVHGDAIPAGRAKPTIEGAWMPDRRVLAELLSRTLENRSRRWLPESRRYMAMPEEWPDVLRNRWPGQFDCELSIGNGWVDLLLATHTWLIELGADFRWSQIKEKFGGARFYHDGDVGELGNEIINVAESVASFCICEACGGPGRLTSKRGWYLTRCDDHLSAAR